MMRPAIASRDITTSIMVVTPRSGVIDIGATPAVLYVHVLEEDEGGGITHEMKNDFRKWTWVQCFS